MHTRSASPSTVKAYSPSPREPKWIDGLGEPQYATMPPADLFATQRSIINLVGRLMNGNLPMPKEGKNPSHHAIAVKEMKSRDRNAAIDVTRDLRFWTGNPIVFAPRGAIEDLVVETTEKFFDPDEDFFSSAADDPDSSDDGESVYRDAVEYQEADLKPAKSELRGRVLAIWASHLLDRYGYAPSPAE